MEITSLGYRTDVMVRRCEGAEVAQQDGYLVVRSPANPGFWWGNFLLIPAPAPGETGGWLDRFASHFPGSEHAALGVDVTAAVGADIAGFLAAGFTAEYSIVLTTDDVREPPRASRDALIRPLTGDDDWRQSAELRAACMDSGTVDGEDAVFLRRRAAQARALTEAGHGTWFGAFRAGRLLAQAGVVWSGGGGPAAGGGDGLAGSGDLARYQDVETHPGERRQGLAGTLVYRAGLHALQRPGVHTLVIVADPAGEAARLYRSAGFAGAEEQLALLRPPPRLDHAWAVTRAGPQR